MKILVEKKVVYDRETLFDQVWEEPIVRVAEKYGVSDVMIHKYCRKLDIPTPPAGYWRKKEMGCKVPKKPKLPNFKGLPKIVGTGRFEEEVPDQVIVKEDGTKEHVDPYRLSDELEEKCKKAASAVEIVARRKWHPVIEKHIATVTEWSKNHWTDPLAKCGEQPWEWHPYPAPVLWEQITVKAMPKFHTLMNAIILALESVGCSVIDGFYAVIGEEKVRFGAFETRERVLHDPERWKKENPKSYYYVSSNRKYDYRRNGEINFYVYHSERGYRTYPEIIYEKKHPDQKKLAAVVIDEIFHAVPYARKERLEREERERRYREEEERRVRQQELIRIEKRKVYELTENTNNYIIACNIRAYAAAVESKTDLSEEEKKWVVWAREKADWIDPMIRKEDAILGKYSKSVLNKDAYY